MNTIRLKRVAGLYEWSRIWILYRGAFPKDERKPFKIFRDLWRRGKSDVWCLYDGKEFKGFASTINSNTVVMIDFFAVLKNSRGRGYGKQALRLLQEQYREGGIFIEIESVFEAVNDIDVRRRRKRFYIENGFIPVHVLADVFGVPMELMCWHCKIDYETYHRFYHDNYSPFAASHLKPMDYPDGGDAL